MYNIKLILTNTHSKKHGNISYGNELSFMLEKKV